MKKFIFAVLSVLLVACSDESVESVESFDIPGSDVTVEELIPDNVTRLSNSGTSFKWVTGDQFSCTDGSKVGTFTYDGSNFKASGRLNNAAGSYAYVYPATNTLTFDAATVDIPTTINGGQIVLPLVGTSTVYGKVQFKFASGVLKLEFDSAPTTLTVTSTKDIAGTATINVGAATATITGSKTVTIENPSTVNFVALPVGSQQITVTYDGTTETLSPRVGQGKLYSCSYTTSTPACPSDPCEEHECVYLLNEGNWQSDNGQLSYIFDGNITNKYFQQVNGTKLGDTPQHIIQINKELIAISMNWSNIVYFLRPDATLVAQTEDIPNCRYMCTDGDYVYITSYAHETALGETYERGYVAKISTTDFQVKATCEVGYEPEGIALWNGKLYIANTGGYAFSEGHDYENTISVVDPSTMTKIKDIELYNNNGDPVINLYGMMSQSGSHLMINSPGDYMSIPPVSVVFDCADESYVTFEDMPCTYNTVLPDGRFLAVGSSFSYMTGGYEYFNWWYDPADGSMDEADFGYDVTEFQNPYCVYCNPYTGHIYITDAGSYAGAGKVCEYYNGQLLNTMKCYICPGHMLAVPYADVYATRAATRAFNEVVRINNRVKDHRAVSINDKYSRK